MTNHPHNIISMLANTASTKEKESILTQNKDNELLKRCFLLAYSPTINFFMKQIPDYSFVEDVYGIDECLNMLGKLSSRWVTGNAAKDFVVDILSHTSAPNANIIINILKGDLRCGVGKTLVNKVWKGLIELPPRKGAKSMNDKSLAAIKFPAAIELKGDGSYASWNGKFLSRNGNEIEGLTLLEKELSHPAFEGFALEGELVFDLSKATREEGNGIITKIIRGTATQEERDSVIYLVWDCIDSRYYTTKGKYTVDNTTRREFLEQMVSESGCTNIEIIPRDIVNSMEEAHAIFEEYVRSGYEGAILKNLHTPWVDNGRPNDCVKIKKKEPADLVIVGKYEGEGKAAGMLGGYKLESSCGIIKVSCGSGFSDEQRIQFWAEEDIGMIVETEYDSVTEDKKTGQKSLFLPIFKTKRYDKNVADSYSDILEKQRIK